MTTFITVAVISALCLVFSTTRKYGVVGAGLLLYFQPYSTIGVLLFGWIAYLYILRRHPNVLSNYILDALEIVSAWDLPDEDLADTVNAQARLMAGINPDELWEVHVNGN